MFLRYGVKRALCLRAASMPHFSASVLRRYSSSASSLLQHVQLRDMAHQSRLQLQIDDRTQADVQIVPILNEKEFALKVFAEDADADQSASSVFHVQKDESEADGKVKHVRLLKDSATSNLDSIVVQLFLPHLVDLSINVVRGNVSIRDKVEGNVQVTLGEGDVRVNKIRGKSLLLKTNNGSVEVTTVVEGEMVKVVANHITCKRLMAGKSEVKLQKGAEAHSKCSEFGAMYSSICTISNAMSKSKLHIGNTHGYVRISGDDMKSVVIDSVNGALHLEDMGSSCNVTAHFDSWQDDAESSIFAAGDIALSIEPNMAMDVELHGNQVQTSGCTFKSSEVDQIDTNYTVFSGEIQANGANSKASTAASGKINVQSAKTAALRTSFFAKDIDAKQEEASHRAPSFRPRLLAHSSGGQVTLEQLDWIAKMKRKHLRK